MQTKLPSGLAVQSPVTAIVFLQASLEFDATEDVKAHRPVSPDVSVSVSASLDTYNGPVAFQKRKVSAMHGLESARKCTKHGTVLLQ